MRNSLETRVGMFLAIATLAIFVTLEMVGGFSAIRKGMRVTALFNTVQELKIGDPVKMAGVNIGRVEGIGFEGNKVKVTLKIKPDAAVRTDSKAVIRFAGLMGQNFVSIDFGTPTAPLVDPTTVSVLSTAEQPDLGAMLARLDAVAGGIENLTKSFTGVDINTLLGPLTAFIKESREPLGITFSNLMTISTKVAQGDGTVGKLLNDEAFYTAAYATVTNMQSAGSDIKLALGDATKLMRDVSEGKGSIGKLITDESMYRETTNSLVNLREILEKVNKGGGTFGMLVNDPSLFKNANLTLQKVDKATESLEDQGILTVMGIAIGRLF